MHVFGADFCGGAGFMPELARGLADHFEHGRAPGWNGIQPELLSWSAGLGTSLALIYCLPGPA
jgi:hypothetical protein